MDLNEIKQEFERKKNKLKGEIEEAKLALGRLKAKHAMIPKNIAELREKKTETERRIRILKEHIEKIRETRKEKALETEIITDQLTRLEARKKRFARLNSVLVKDEEEEKPKEEADEIEKAYPALTYNGRELRSEDFPSLIWIQDFMALTGGALYAKDREPNDIDVIVKARDTGEGGFSVELDPALNLKIARILEKTFPGKEVHWTASPEGSNWKHCVLYDLVLVPKKQLSLTEMNEPEFAERFYDATKKVTLFKPFPMLKPMHGRHKEEMYSIDSVIEVVESRPDDWYKEGVSVQVKADGVHCQCHTDGKGNSRIFTEEGNDITSKLCTLAAELGKGGTSYIICGELEFWEDSEHQSRQKTTAIIHKKQLDPDESKVILTAFDCVYTNGKDIHNETYAERWKELKKIPKMAHVKIIENRVVRNEDDLRTAIKYFADKSGSEGAYLKRWIKFPYELDGKTLNNLKYKTTAGIDCQIVEVHKVKDANAWNYLCAIKDGGKLVPIGKTFNTSIEAKVGEILKVEFVDINRYATKDTKRVWYSWWSPRVIMLRSKKEPDTVETAERLVKATGGELAEKEWPRRYKSIISDEQYTPWLKAPDENERWRGMMQFDCRKKSVHTDFRYQTDKNNIFTWTLFLSKGLSKIPEDEEEAKRMLTSEILPLVEETMEDPMKKFNCKPEKRIEATRDVFKQDVLGGGPGETQPRYMWNFDAYGIEMGAIKPNYIEIFCHGEVASGKIVFTKIVNREEWKKTPIGLMTWFMFQTKDQTPYTIGRRAVKKKYIPEYGRSALPRKVRRQIPEEFHYWKIKDEKARMKKRDDLVEAIKKKEVKIEIKEFVEDAATSGEFIFQKQTWKSTRAGQVRKTPSRTEYHLLLKAGKTIKDYISDAKPPSAGVMKRGTKTRWRAEGDIETKTRLNPTPDTPSKIEIEDQGKFRFLNKEGTMLKLEGKEMKGVYVLKEDKDSGITNLKKLKGGE